MKLGDLELTTVLKKISNSASWLGLIIPPKDMAELNQAITNLSPLDLASLDLKIRTLNHSYISDFNQSWDKLRSAGISRLAKSQYAVCLLGLSSFHHNGYVRETAVNLLAQQRTGKELPFLLIRLNDWVIQVREAALAAIKKRIKPVYAAFFLINMELVLRLKRAGRVDQILLDEIINLLRSPECQEVLQNGMTCKDKNIRRISYKLAHEADVIGRQIILGSAINDPDTVVRYWAARHFLPEVPPEEIPDLIKTMLGDRYMPVRREALWVIATKRPDLATGPIRRALLDNHVSIRETARHFISLALIADARTFYIEAIQRGVDSERYAAICGLAENGVTADASFILSYTDSQLPKLRRAAVYALGKLSVEGNLARLVGSLSDPNASVSREALKALLPQARLIPLDNLEDLLTRADKFHSRRNALTLIQHFDKWRKLPALLISIGYKDLQIAELALAAVREWFANYNRSFSEPTLSDFKKIQACLPGVEAKLPHHISIELRDCLKIYFK
ncbi:MAG TPA: hypothetical protein VF607_02740 [Verrucomicrobiae bacterium]